MSFAPAGDLQGKKIMIATAPGQFFADPIKKELEKRGATVVFSQHSPHNLSNVEAIIKEVSHNRPHALLIHRPNLLEHGSIEAVTEIATCTKIPVLVEDAHAPHFPGVREITQFGVGYLPPGEPEKVAYAIADRIAQQGRETLGRG